MEEINKYMYLPWQTYISHTPLDPCNLHTRTHPLTHTNTQILTHTHARTHTKTIRGPCEKVRPGKHLTYKNYICDLS